MRVALKNFRIQTEGYHAFLNTRATGVVNPNHRCTNFESEVHHLHYLLSEDFTEAAAEDGEVLGKDTDGTSINRSMAGNYAIAIRAGFGHIEIH